MEQIDDKKLEQHAKEYHGITLNQFKLMCNEAHERFEGQFTNSVDKALAVESFYDGFKVAIKALEQPAQEPVAFTNEDELSELKSGMTTCYMYKQAIDDNDIALYTHPCVLTHSAPSWQGLSDDEIDKLPFYDYMTQEEVNNVVHAIEAKLKEKNGR